MKMSMNISEQYRIQHRFLIMTPLTMVSHPKHYEAKGKLEWILKVDRDGTWEKSGFSRYNRKEFQQVVKELGKKHNRKIDAFMEKIYLDFLGEDRFVGGYKDIYVPNWKNPWPDAPSQQPDYSDSGFDPAQGLTEYEFLGDVGDKG